MFGPHAKPGSVRRRHIKRDCLRDRGKEFDLRITRLDRHQVHLRAADEFGNELVLRQVVQCARTAGLHDLALIQDDDSVCQRHRLDLVMRHIDSGDAKLFMKARDFQPHIHPQRGVEIRQRLIKQEPFRFANDGAADGDTLALTARKLLWQPVEKRLEAQDFRHLLNAAVDLGLADTCRLQREPDIGRHIHMRVQRVGLEHHRQATLGRQPVGHVIAINLDRSDRGILEAGKNAQKR